MKASISNGNEGFGSPLNTSWNGTLVSPCDRSVRKMSSVRNSFDNIKSPGSKRKLSVHQPYPGTQAGYVCGLQKNVENGDDNLRAENCLRRSKVYFMSITYSRITSRKTHKKKKMYY